jgi:hypothetical protein
MRNEEDDTIKELKEQRQVVARSNVLKLHVDADGLKVAETWWFSGLKSRGFVSLRLGSCVKQRKLYAGE